MDIKQLKENRLFFLFSKLNNLRSENVHVMLAVDTFRNDDNQFLNLIDISKRIEKIGIVCSPEKLKEVIDKIEYNNLFDGYDPQSDTDRPFRLKKEYYNNVSDLTNNTQKLEQIVDTYVKENNLKPNKKEVIINILLETLITKNLDFLRLVVKPKQQELIEGFKLKSPLKRYKEKDFEVYNSFITNVDGDFNNVLEALLLKVTDFLNLNYNPDSDKFIHEKLGDKKFYLDSSVVMRLLGFNNEIREERARRLLELLKNITGVHFFIHAQTLSETQDRVNKIIDESQKLLKHEEKLMHSTNSRSGKGSNTVDLFFRQKQRGEVQNIHDFTLYYSNISLLLRKLFGADSRANA